MKVTVVFDFPMITDPDSGEATDVIEYLTALTVEQQNAWRLRFESDKCSVYVDDAQGESEEATCPYCGRVLDDEDTGGVCSSDDCPRHEQVDLEDVQTALFAACDVKNALDPDVLEQEHDEQGSDTIGALLEIVIETLEELAKEMGGDEE